MTAKLSAASKIYKSGDQEITALHPVDLSLEPAKLLLIIGASGSGKTTLLSLFGCLINPTQGILEINGKNVAELSAKEMAKLRLTTLGFVFQQFNLLSPLTTFENIEFPLKMMGVKSTERKRRVEKALENVNMTHRKKSLPKTLSGGEQQRIAIARALVTDPAIILCDEPTASLDQGAFEVVMTKLKELAATGKAVAVVTHDPRLTKYADKTVEVTNGIVKEIKHDVNN